MDFGPPFGMDRATIVPATSVYTGEVNDAETLIWQGAYSGRSMIGSLIAVLVASLLVPVMILLVEPMRLNTTVWLVGAALLAIVWAGWISTMLFQKLSRHYVITTQRIKHRRGILVPNVGCVELIDVDDVNYRQGFVQSILGVGDVRIISNDSTHSTLKIRGIANVSRIAGQIDDARRAERRKRGLQTK